VNNGKIEDRKKLYISRLQESLRKIPSLPGRTVHAAEFKIWRERTQQTLEILSAEFGLNLSYSKQFRNLEFWESRAMSIHGLSWTTEDEQIFEDDLERTKRIVSDALEEMQFVSETPKLNEEKKAMEMAPIVLQITNILSQTTHIEISQVIQGLDSLGLPKEQRDKAEQLARELDLETKGERRWPILTKCIDGLKAIGDSVYKQVAIPLLLEMLKKEMGL
jgi:hypothetical protein